MPRVKRTAVNDELLERCGLTAEGIARRIAWLTREQAWPRGPGTGVMIFTAEPRSPLLGTLAQYGLTEITTL